MPSAPPLYVALVGDIVRSRDVKNRAAVQLEMKTLLRHFKMEESVRSSSVAGPDITAGDEVQLLLRADGKSLPGNAVTTFITQFTEDLFPVGIVFGVGLGTLATPPKGPIQELDGPCFHQARAALDSAKRRGRWVEVAGVSSSLCRVSNAIFRVTGDIRSAWTERQREIVRMRRAARFQKDVARKLKVSPSVVSEVLHAARHEAVLDAEENVAMLLNRTLRPKEFPPWADHPEASE